MRTHTNTYVHTHKHTSGHTYTDIRYIHTKDTHMSIFKYMTE